MDMTEAGLKLNDRLFKRELPPNFRLFRGGHDRPVDGRRLELCFDEAVAWIAGDPHSDSPQCMCPVLAAIGMRLNDRFDDEERQLLVPLLYKAVGTRSTLEVMRKRSYVMVDASVREIAPMALDTAKWTELSARLREIAPIVDTDSARSAQKVTAEILEETRKRRSAAYAYDAYAYDAAAYAYAYDAAAYAYAYDAAAAAAAAAAYAYASADADADAAAYAAAAASAAAAAAAAAAYAYADAAAYANKIRLAARRPIVLVTVAAFERAIAITE